MHVYFWLQEKPDFEIPPELICKNIAVFEIIKAIGNTPVNSMWILIFWSD